MAHASTDSRRFPRWAVVVLASGVAVALFALAFDWNWFRPALERHLAEKSHRGVRIDDFHVSFSGSLDATFRLRGVRIDNAPWADERPFIVARELKATWTLANLLRRRPIINRLELVDADIDLERQADGLRNWRLTQPDYRGPGIIRILALEPIRSRIRFVHRGIGLDLQTAAVALDAPVGAGAPLTTRIDFEGTYGGAKFAGDVLTSRELTFQDTGRYFSLRGHAVSGKTRLEVDGRAADLFKASSVDAHVALQGPSLARLRPYAGAALPESPPYAVSAQLRKELSRYSFSEALVRIGSTDVAGTLAFDMASEPRMLRATLRSEVAHLEDLAWVRQLAGAPRSGARVRAEGTVPAASAPPLEPAARALPASGAGSAPGSRIHTLDAELQLEVKRLTLAALPVSASLLLTAKLADDVLAITPIDLAFSGGHVTGELTFDSSRERSAARTRIKVRDVRIERILTPDKKPIEGAIQADIDLAAHGDSMAALLGTVSGSMAARMVDGSMSGRLDAELGLSGTRFLRALIGADKLVPIRCAVAEFEFRDGKGHSRMLLIDTERTSVEGTGIVELRSGAFDLLLTPRPDRPGLLELHKAIRLQGTPGHVAYALAEPAAQTSGRRCLERKP